MKVEWGVVGAFGTPVILVGALVFASWRQRRHGRRDRVAFTIYVGVIVVIVGGFLALQLTA